MNGWIIVLIILLVIAAIIGLVYLSWRLYSDFEDIDSWLMGLGARESKIDDYYHDYFPVYITFLFSVIFGVLAGMYAALMRVVHMASFFWYYAHDAMTLFLIAFIGLIFANIILASVSYKRFKNIIKRVFLSLLYCLLGASAGFGASVILVVALVITLAILVISTPAGDDIDADISLGLDSFDRDSRLYWPSADGAGTEEMHMVYDDIYRGPGGHLYKHLGGSNFEPWSAQ